MDNCTIARRLTEHAAELEARCESMYRVRAYRKASWTVRSVDRPLSEILEESGRAGLQALPGIGAHLAYTIAELIRTGELRTWVERDVANGAAR